MVGSILTLCERKVQEVCEVYEVYEIEEGLKIFNPYKRLGIFVCRLKVNEKRFNALRWFNCLRRLRRLMVQASSNY